MNAEAYENLRRKQFGEAKIYAVIMLIVLSSMGYYFYVHFNIYNLQKKSITLQEKEIEKIIEKTDKEKKLYTASKPLFESQRKGLNDKLKVVFPETSNEISFTKRIDKLESKLSIYARTHGGGDFMISSINYSSPVLTDTYSVLPFVLNISTSYEQLLDFLKLVEASGSISHEDGQERLMSVESINLTLPQDKTDNSNATMNFSVKLNAYYQKTNTVSGSAEIK